MTAWKFINIYNLIYIKFNFVINITFFKVNNKYIEGNGYV